jgi:hypothetical protein
MASYTQTSTEAGISEHNPNGYAVCPMPDCRCPDTELYGFGSSFTYACLGCGIAFYACLQPGDIWLVTTRYADVAAVVAAEDAAVDVF